MTDDLDLTQIRQRLAAARWGGPMDYPTVASITECARDVEPLLSKVERLRALRPATSQAVMAHMARADAAEAAIARVRELADEWRLRAEEIALIEDGAKAYGIARGLIGAADDLTRALDGEVSE